MIMRHIGDSAWIQNIGSIMNYAQICGVCIEYRRLYPCREYIFCLLQSHNFQKYKFNGFDFYLVFLLYEYCPNLKADAY